MTVKNVDCRHVWLFFAVAYTFSWIFWIPNALAAHGMNLPTGIAEFLASPYNPAAFDPLVAAIVLTLFQQGWRGTFALLKRGFDFRFKKVWLVVILLLPPVIFLGELCSRYYQAQRNPIFRLSPTRLMPSSPSLSSSLLEDPCKKSLVGAGMPCVACSLVSTHWFPARYWVSSGGCVKITSSTHTFSTKMKGENQCKQNQIFNQI